MIIPHNTQDLKLIIPFTNIQINGENKEKEISNNKELTVCIVLMPCAGIIEP